LPGKEISTTDPVWPGRKAGDVSEKPAVKTPHLLRGMGPVDATTLVVGSMIGSGIFIVSAESGRVAGSPGWLLAAWAVAGVLTMIASLSCAELAAMLPKAGGQYVFFREAYGPLFGFLFGWTMFLVVQSGTIAAVAVAFAKFLGVLWPAVSGANKLFTVGRFSVSAVQIVGLLVVAILTASNATGLKTGTRTQNVFTFAKFAALFALTALGLVLGRSGALGSAAEGFWKSVSAAGEVRTGWVMVAVLATAMVGPLFSQSAWNNVTFAGEEVRDPGRTLPRALLLGCLLVTVIYVLANVSYLRVLSFDEIRRAPEDRVATAAATALFGPGAAAVMAAAIMI
jgi:APA family basic amino acid/polyamine antiporter